MPIFESFFEINIRDMALYVFKFYSSSWLIGQVGLESITQPAKLSVFRTLIFSE